MKGRTGRVSLITDNKELRDNEESRLTEWPSSGGGRWDMCDTDADTQYRPAW